MIKLRRFGRRYELSPNAQALHWDRRRLACPASPFKLFTVTQLRVKHGRGRRAACGPSDGVARSSQLTYRRPLMLNFRVLLFTTKQAYNILLKC